MHLVPTCGCLFFFGQKVIFFWQRFAYVSVVVVAELFDRAP
jgi:hypothetical protein